jgi:predicted dienelactone hydrolase
LLGAGTLLSASIVGLGLLLLHGTLKPARTVGVQTVHAADSQNPAISAVIYYPARGEAKLTWLGITPAMLATGAPIEGERHPLILISHGTAGSPTGHLDTALALAERGYIVAAIVHNGDNYQDQSSVGAASWISNRAHEVTRLVDYLLGEWDERAAIDSQRIGLFGFSAGATGALANIGATPDFARVAPACQAHPELVCRLVHVGTVLTNPAIGEAYDSRIRAAVLAAPGFGMAFPPEALAGVTIPVDIWIGANDDNTPPQTNALAIAQRLPAQPQAHLVEGAGHASFLAPCGAAGLLMPPIVCRDPRGFDRAAFHRTFDAEVVAFFNRTLDYDTRTQRQ